MPCRYHELDKRAAAFLEGTGERLPLEKAERDRIIGHTTSFAKSAKMRDAALALYVNAQVSPHPSDSPTSEQFPCCQGFCDEVSAACTCGQLH